jgi:hypothetical protein
MVFSRRVTQPTLSSAAAHFSLDLEHVSFGSKAGTNFISIETRIALSCREQYSDLAYVAQQVGEPRHRHVELLAASDALELDRAQFVAPLLVLAHDAGLAP